MKLSKRIIVNWFKDKRYDKTIYAVSTMYRIGRIGIDIIHRNETLKS